MADQPLDEARETDDPGSTSESVLVHPPPYKIGSEPEPELPLDPPKNRREAFLMAKAMVARSGSRLNPARPDELMAVADWLLGIEREVEQERPDMPPPVVGTASAYEPVRRDRPSGLAFLYMHPPCFAVEWRDASQSLQTCTYANCSDRNSRWVVLFREKA
jgi:hypothetical protein